MKRQGGCPCLYLFVRKVGAFFAACFPYFCGYFAIAQYDKGFVILSGVRKHKAKNPQNLRYTLNLWILRCAQYDKNLRYKKRRECSRLFCLFAKSACPCFEVLLY